MMTWVFSTAGNFYNPGVAPGCSMLVYTLTKFLINMSGSPWTLPKWSDGSNVYTDNGATLTSATQLNGSRAWVRLAMPGGSGREFVFQRHTSDSSIWRIKYTPTGGFVTGGTGQNTPSATSEVYVAGGSTDASPSFDPTGMGYPGGLSNLTNRFYIGADNAAPSGWYAASICLVQGGIRPMNMWFCDPLLPGSYPSEDTDPYVIASGYNNYATDINWYASSFYSESNSMLARGFLGSLASSSFVPLYIPAGVTYSGSGWIPWWLGSNPFSAKDDLFRCIWARRNSLTAPTGYKGISSTFSYSTVPRNHLDTMSVSTTRDRFLIGNMWMPWDGSIPQFG